MKLIRHEGYARAGLVGNPTDGYGGKTISFTMTNFKATVVMYPWEQLEILWSQEDKNRFNTIHDLVEDVTLNGYYGGVRLVKATIKRFADYCSKWESNWPICRSRCVTKRPSPEAWACQAPVPSSLPR